MEVVDSSPGMDGATLAELTKAGAYQQLFDTQFNVQ
jgi:hypothetical protein